MRHLGYKKAYQSGSICLGLSFAAMASAATDKVSLPEPMLLACHTQTCLAGITVTTSTKTPRKLADVPVRTEVVTRQELLKTHAKDLTEALRYVPGIELKPIHGKTGYGIWLQGLDADRVLVLIDGNRVSASTGSAVDTSQISVSDIERIEVVKGAVSALYGTSAMGGVVNIITRKSQDPVTASVLVEGGSWGEQNTGDSVVGNRHLMAQLGINQEKFSVSLTGDLRDSDGFKVDQNSIDTQGWAGQKGNLSAKLQYRFTPDFKVTLTPRLYREDVSNLMSEYSPGNGVLVVNKKEQAEGQHVSAQIENTLASGISWQINTMLESFSDKVQQDKRASRYVDQQRNSEISHKALSGQVNLPLGQSNLLTLGAELSVDEMDVVQFKNNGTVQERIVEVDSKSIQASEVFAQNSWFITDKIELLPGVRLHHDDNFGEHISPMVNALWQVGATDYGQFNVRGGVGNGYRIPNLKERYYVFDHSHLGYKVMGNADLKPESSISYQASLEWLKGESTRVELSAFKNDVENLIQTELDAVQSAATNLQIYNYQNLAKAQTQGVDLAINFYITPRLKTDLSYGYIDAKDLQTQKQLTNRAQFHGKIGLDWQTPLSGLGLLLKGNYQSSQYEDAQNTLQTPEFMTWDVRMNHQFHKEWTWFAGVKNLTDVQKNFSQADSRPEEGRYAYLGVRWSYQAAR